MLDFVNVTTNTGILKRIQGCVIGLVVEMQLGTLLVVFSTSGSGWLRENVADDIDSSKVAAQRL